MGVGKRYRIFELIEPVWILEQATEDTLVVAKEEEG